MEKRNDVTSRNTYRIRILEKIAAQAEEVRTCQKRYFSHRNKEHLNQSISEERKLDSMISEYKNLKNSTAGNGEA